MPTLPTLALICATLTTALIAGLLYGYSCSVNPGLNRLSDSAYLAAMQSINSAILNPAFFLTFMGSAFLLPACAWLHYGQPVSSRFWLLVAAIVTYLVGVLGVTMLNNVPLNEALASFTIEGASVEELAAQRAKFETPWNNWHTVRTVASVVTLLLMIVACLSQKTE